MRKWFLLLAVFLVLLTIGVYAFIPNKVTLVQKTELRVNTKAFTRAILDETIWKEWWPGEVVVNPSGRPTYFFLYKGKRYAIIGKRISSHLITIHFDNDSMLSQMLFVSGSSDSVSLSWNAVNVTSYQPLKRINRYRALKDVEEDWKTILEKMQRFYSNEANLYQLPIQKELVKDSLLISTILKTPEAPTTDTIYHLIDRLKAFANKKGAKQTGFPMLNITSMIRDDKSIYYRIQVALPVDRKLEGEGDIVYRWMLGKGKILAAEVSGGPQTIKSAFEKMEEFVEDHQLVAPAIPFESLLTDRRMEKDTTKWKTKIYWPVI